MDTKYGKSLRVRTSHLAVAALATIGLVSGCSVTDRAAVAEAVPVVGPATTAEPSTYLVGGRADDPVQEPASFVLACADGGQRLDQLVWTGWGTPQATATGVVEQNTCEPSCADGSDVAYPVRVTASGWTAGTAGTASATYDHLTVSATGEVPAGLEPAFEIELPLDRGPAGS